MHIHRDPPCFQVYFVDSSPISLSLPLKSLPPALLDFITNVIIGVDVSGSVVLTCSSEVQMMVYAPLTVMESTQLITSATFQNRDATEKKTLTAH